MDTFNKLKIYILQHGLILMVIKQNIQVYEQFHYLNFNNFILKMIKLYNISSAE